MARLALLDARLNVAVPTPLALAVQKAADARLTSSGAYVRGAVLRQLHEDGYGTNAEKET